MLFYSHSTLERTNVMNESDSAIVLTTLIGGCVLGFFGLCLMGYGDSFGGPLTLFMAFALLWFSDSVANDNGMRH